MQKIFGVEKRRLPLMGIAGLLLAALIFSLAADVSPASSTAPRQGNPTPAPSGAAQLAPGQVAISFPVSPFDLPYGLAPGGYVDIFVSFSFIDVDPQFQTALPNSVALLSQLDSGEIVVGEPRPGRVEPSTLSATGVMVGPGEAQRPRRVVQRTIQRALVVQVADLSGPGATGGGPAQANKAAQPVQLTLGVTPQDAAVLVWLLKAQLPLAFVLYAEGGEPAASLQPVTLDYILQTFTVAPPNTLPFTVEP